MKKSRITFTRRHTGRLVLAMGERESRSLEIILRLAATACAQRDPVFCRAIFEHPELEADLQHLQEAVGQERQFFSVGGQIDSKSSTRSSRSVNNSKGGAAS